MVAFAKMSADDLKVHLIKNPKDVKSKRLRERAAKLFRETEELRKMIIYLEGQFDETK